MPQVSTQLLFEKCYSRFAIAAVNVFTMEQVHGLFSAANVSKTPIIVQITPVARDYAHPLMLGKMIEAAAAIYKEVVFSVHLDHGFEKHIHQAIEENYNSVMIDASFDDYETNVKRTRAVVVEARRRQIMVEAELGVLSGVEDEKKIDDKHSKYTDPDQVADFVSRTGCNSLAVAVGTSHGAYKTNAVNGLQFFVLEAIQKKMPKFPLVLHGSSKVDKAVVNEINNLGGQIDEKASGIKDEDIQEAIKFGVCKVNIATDLRLLWTKVHRSFFVNNPGQFDPIIPGKLYEKELEAFLIERFEVLNSIGTAGLFV